MARISLLTLLVIASHFTVAQTDETVSQPLLWLRGDAGTEESNVWKDQTTFQKNATSPNTVGPQPSAYLNYNRVLLFDGQEDNFGIAHSIEGVKSLTAIAVFHSEDTVERGVWGTVNSPNRNLQVTTRRTSTPDSLIEEYGKNENLAVLNTIFQSWQDDQLPTEGGQLKLGISSLTATPVYFKGKMAEFIVFHEKLDFLELIKIETYLAIKYGITLTRGNYVNSVEELLWSRETNKSYNNHITALGRDDHFQLNQKQSGSTADELDLINMSFGTKASSNTENNSIVPDRHFLVWGNNGSELLCKPGTGIDSLVTFLQRKWVIEARGQQISSLPTELELKVSHLPESLEGYWLVIDRSGQENFSVDNLEYIEPVSSANGIAVFKNIQWDTDGSGKDSFGFVKAQKMLLVLPNIISPTCLNKNGGAVDVQVVGGSAPYVYTLTEMSTGSEVSLNSEQQQYQQENLNIGEYKITVKDAANNVFDRSVTLLMPDTLVINLGEDLNLKTSPAFTLNAAAFIPANEPVEYEWSNNFGFSDSNPQVTITESGIYTATIKRLSDGCVCSDQITVSGTSSERFAVFPTILHHDEPFNVSVSLPEQGNVQVRIIGMRGNVINQQYFQAKSEYHLNGKLTEAGLYLVMIQTPSGVQTKKLIVY